MPNNQLVPISTQLVKRSNLFSTLPDALVEEITKNLRAERWSKKTHISPDVLLERFFILEEGRIEMSRVNPDTGRSVTLDLLQPGDSFDVVILLDGQAHDVILSPLEEIKVLSIPMHKMREWIWKYPALNQQFMPYLAKKIREQEDKTTDIALYDTVTRLSRIILKNLNKIKNYRGLAENAHTEHLITGLSDEVLARMVGSVRQVINQHLQEWKKKGVIDKKRNKIIINNLQQIIDDADITSSHF